MGISIKGLYADSPVYDMGYITFFALRRDIAYTISEEFGQHYSDMPKAGFIGFDEYDRRTEELIKKHHCKERFLSFLYQSDCNGKLSPYKCKALLDQINGMQSKKLYGYTAYPNCCLTIDKFRELLKECFDRKVYLVWY